MKAKELKALLENVNPEAEIVADIEGGLLYQIDVEETEEQNNPDELKTCDEYLLICLRYTVT